MPQYLTSTLCNCLTPLLDKLKPSDFTLATILNASDAYESPSWVEDDLNALKKSGFKLVDLDLRKSSAVEDFINNSEINGIFVAGGNSFYLLEIMKQSGLFDYLKANIEKYLYIGSSAGSVVCCQDIGLVRYIDKPLSEPKFDLIGLGILKSLILPHINHPYFESKYQKLTQSKDFAKQSVITLADNQALWVEKGSMGLVEV
jgi:dipeptidase E